MRRRLLAILVIISVFTGVFWVGANYTEFGLSELAVTGGNPSVTTLHLWYTDESMTDYLNSAALAFYEKTGNRVQIEYKTGLEYLEEINEATLHTQEAPDVYLVSNDSLEKAYLTGLAAEILDSNGVVTEKYFPKTSLNAVTYQGKLVAYPMYFETSAFIYNKTYLEKIAASAIEALDDAQEGEAAGTV